ncbi:unnamed protein product, partial [marine sediment metagenome]
EMYDKKLKEHKEKQGGLFPYHPDNLTQISALSKALYRIAAGLSYQNLVWTQGL